MHCVPGTERKSKVRTAATLGRLAGVTCMDYNETERFLEILIFHVWEDSLMVGQYLVRNLSLV